MPLVSNKPASRPAYAERLRLVEELEEQSREICATTSLEERTWRVRGEIVRGRQPRAEGQGVFGEVPDAFGGNCRLREVGSARWTRENAPRTAAPPMAAYLRGTGRMWRGNGNKREKTRLRLNAYRSTKFDI